MRSRRGGELLPQGNPVIHKSVKKLLQEAQVPPWQRNSFPLIYVGEELAAVWQVAVAVKFSQPGGDAGRAGNSSSEVRAAGQDLRHNEPIA